MNASAEITHALACLTEPQLDILTRAGSQNDAAKYPELVTVGGWLRSAARWEIARRNGGATLLPSPVHAISATDRAAAIHALRICECAAIVDVAEVPKGLEAASFYLAVARSLTKRNTLQ